MRPQVRLHRQPAASSQPPGRRGAGLRSRHPSATCQMMCAHSRSIAPSSIFTTPMSVTV